MPTCFQQYHARYCHLFNGPATGPRIETVEMMHQNDVHNDAVLPKQPVVLWFAEFQSPTISIAGDTAAAYLIDQRIIELVMQS